MKLINYVKQYKYELFVLFYLSICSIIFVKSFSLWGGNLYKNLVDKWLNSNNIDEKFKKEIYNLDEKELEDRFYKELEFGTGGVRGIIGSGINRINIYTIGKVTQGYANFLKNKFKGEEVSVAIAYDSRIKSDEFAKRAALIFAANGIKVYLYESLRPTPMLSFAIRELKCSGGVVITASHNPKEYSGYKVYDNNGCQLTDELASKVYDYICDISIFEKIEILDENEAVKLKKLEYIGEKIDNIYIENVKNLVIRKDLVKNNSSDLKIVYTPLHGSGYYPITRVLDELGFDKLMIVEEQKNPDGNFITVPYPNPELESVFDLGINLAKNNDADIIFATDPDCDRVGVVVKDKFNNYKFLTGNQIGILLSEYILMSLREFNQLDSNGIIVKTIVSTNVVEDICREYKIDYLDVLTGFKYIGEKINEFEMGNDKKYIFGFEESYGFLIGTFVRDKDAVIAVTILSEMALYYKKNGKTLNCVLDDLYKKYGYSSEKLVSIELKGKEGQEKISKCLNRLRNLDISEISYSKVLKVQDYQMSIEKDFLNKTTNKISLPVSNVFKVIFENKNWFVVRPSGTEPKMKIYLSVRGGDKKNLNYDICDFEKYVLSLIEKCMG